MVKRYADKPQVLAAAEVLKSGAAGARIERGRIIWDGEEGRSIEEVDAIRLRINFEVQGRGLLGQRTMWAAIRLAEGYSPDEIWEVKRRAKN